MFYCLYWNTFAIVHAKHCSCQTLFMPNMFLFDPAAEAWESDDNLSDGGDFFEEEDFQPSPLDCLKASIPVVPAVQVMAVMFSVIVRDLN